MSNIKEEIKKIIELYDSKLDFGTYAQSMGLFDYNGERQTKICCPLHDENTPSFSYSSERGIWTCFGQCHTTGKVCKFHILYMKKTNRNTTVLQALKDLQKKFPTILPEIKLNNSVKKSEENLLNQYNEFIKSQNEVKIEIKQKNVISGFSKIDSSSRDILSMFITGSSQNI